MNRSVKDQPEGLQEVFKTFNELSEQLASTYQVLENRVSQLDEELTHSRNEQFLHLKEKERLADRLTILLKALPAAVIVIDAAGVVREFNPAAVAMLDEPLLGIAWRDIIQRAFAPKVDDGHEISLRDGRRVSITTNPLNEEPGQIVMLMDVTETRRLQNQLNQQERLTSMGKMAASLAHQIRTPLSSALLYASSLKRSVVTDEQRHSYVEKMLACIRHLESLVRDMLIFSRGEFGETSFVNINQLLQHTLSISDSAIKNSHTELQFVNEVGEEVGVLGNADILASALQNLINNAIEAMGNNGQLIIAARLDQDGDIEILVRDSGVGIPEEMQQKIFEPFFTTRDKGTGLGLAVVKTVVAAHKGEIFLQSRPGQGTAFVIRLPVSRSGEKESDPLAQKVPTAEKKQVTHEGE